ncbi:hypothetical protein FEE59_17830 [Herbaspirillum sp. RU 5E]|nr:hypothetical protein [Herbaspirillum sp. RU 5E]
MRKRPSHGVLGKALLGGLRLLGKAHASTMTRASSFQYPAATGVLTKEVITADRAQLRPENRYTCDAYGSALWGRTVSVLCALIIPVVPALAQMNTPGQFQVNAGGAAAYSLQIDVSPGSGGMQPKLSLNYNSQSGNGLLGLGWGLGGIGNITRCARTIAQDGIRGGVNYDQNDRFCLDGERLIAVNGRDGADGTEYRTERESFARIVSYGTAGNGPAWFKVWTKAGQTMEYGRENDSKVILQANSSVHAWSLGRIADSVGNTIVFRYSGDSLDGEYLPISIEYLGNGKEGQPLKNAVRFEYQQRPDVSTKYTAGGFIRSSRLLAAIYTNAGASRAWEYRLKYAPGQISRLESISECDVNANCKLPTRFSWFESTTGLPKKVIGTTVVANENWRDAYDIYPGDYNGDGTSDLFLVGSAASYFCAGPGITVKNNCVQTLQGNWKDSYAIYPGDYNGDGITDLYLVGKNASYFCAGPDISTRNNCVQIFEGNWKDNYAIYPGDYNGDGITDLYLVGQNASYFCAGPGITGTNNCVQTLQGNWKDNYAIYLGDFNGDGVSDLYLIGTSASYFCAGPGIASTNNCVQTLQGNWKDSYAVSLGDFNGDGITDLYLIGTSASYFCAGPGIAATNNCVQTLQGNWKDSYAAFSGDFDGDGISDLYLIGNAASYFCAGPGIVSGNNCVQTVVGDWQTGYRISASDLSGMGRTGFFFAGTNGSFWAEGGAFQNAIRSIYIGNNLAVSLSYAPLTSSSVYTKDSKAFSATYPIQDLQPALYVVSRVEATNGLGASTISEYSYGGLKAELRGRGLLGFRWLQTKQVDTGLTSYAEYQQNWPYTGLPVMSKKTLAGGGNGGVLSQTTTSYGCNDPSASSTTACTIAPGKRYFVYAKQSVESSWDYNGTALPVITTSSEYDNWGNATKVDVTTDDGFKKSTVNTYANDSVNWYLGRLLKSSVTSTAP